MHLPAPKNAVFRGPHPTQLASPITIRVFFNTLLAIRGARFDLQGFPAAQSKGTSRPGLTPQHGGEVSLAQG